jgi:hypothetical protein
MSKSAFILLRGEPIEIRCSPGCSGSFFKQTASRVLSDLSLLPDQSRFLWGLIISPYMQFSSYVHPHPIPPEKPTSTRRLLNPRAILDEHFFAIANSPGVEIRVEFVGSDWPFAESGSNGQSPNSSSAHALPQNQTATSSPSSQHDKQPASYSKLATARNIREFEPKKASNLSRIAKALGIESMTFETPDDTETLSKAICEHGYANNLGEVLYDWYLGAIASTIEGLCKDTMSQETLKGAMSAKHKVLFKLSPKCDVASGHSTKESLVDGVLVVEVRPQDLCNDIATCGSMIESLL